MHFMPYIFQQDGKRRKVADKAIRLRDDPHGALRLRGSRALRFHV